MGTFAPEQCRWIIAPLLDAGMDLDRIRTLLFHLGFQGIADAERSVPVALTAVVRSEPADVRAAWAAVLLRMMLADDPAG